MGIPETPLYSDDVQNPFTTSAATPPSAPSSQYAEDVSNPFKVSGAGGSFDDSDAKEEHPIREFASDIYNTVKGAATGAARLMQPAGPSLAGIGADSGGGVAASQQLQQTGKNYEARKAAGNSLPYRVGAAIAETAGTNVQGMEQAATEGKPKEVAAHALAGMATAAAPLAVEGAVKGAGAVSEAARGGSEAKIAAPIKATIPEAAMQPDKAVAAGDKIYRAVAPTKTDTGFRANVHAAAGDLAQVADKVDWDAVRGGKGLTRGSAPPDMRVRAVHDAVNERMGEMYKTEVEPKIDAVQNTPANLAPNPEAFKYLAQTAGDEATRNLASKAAANPQSLTVSEAYQLARTVNAELNAFERLDPAQQYQIRATNPGINKLNGLDETLNKTINDALTRRGLPGIQNFERRYAAMAAVRRNLAGRMNEVELRRQGLMDRSVGKVGKALASRSGNAIASASAASMADVPVGDFLEKAFKDLKQSGVKPQLDAQPPAPKLALSPSGNMPPSAQRPLSFMDNPNTNESGPVFPGGKGNAPKPPKTSGGTSVLSGEKVAPKTSGTSSSAGTAGANNFKTFAGMDFGADNAGLEQAKSELAAGKINRGQLLSRAQEIKAGIKNGSGESAASIEAQRAAASDKANGVNYYRVDTRSGVGSKMSGLRPEDLRPGPHEAIVKEHPDGTIEELSTGDKARRYNFKKPGQTIGRPPAVSRPGLMRALSK